MRLPTWVPSRRVLTISGLVLLVGLGWFSFDRWGPLARSAWSSVASPPAGESGHGHDHGPAGGAKPAGGVAVEWIQLTDQARRNIGLRTGEVTLGEYSRTVTVPGIVAERPGRTVVRVSAPLTGVVTDVFAEPGQAVKPGEVLFVLRLNRAEIVDAQTAYLGTLEAINVETAEIERLAEAVGKGAVARKVSLEHEYERQKLEARGHAERQALLLLGLSEEQVEGIVRDRRLLQEFRVVVPTPHDEEAEGHLDTVHAGGGPPESRSSPLILDELHVRKGDAVAAGAQLCTLADMNLLYLEGRAFERDAAALTRAAENRWTVSAVPEEGGDAVENLEIAHVENRVDAESRTLVFHAFLPNAVVHETVRGSDRRFPTWRFKPGQRMRVRVPVERLSGKIVLPAAAVAQEGPDAYVFVENGPRFDRRPVQVEYLDADDAVLADDGSLFPGDVVALSGAHQLLMALKNQTVDPSVAAHGHMH